MARTARPAEAPGGGRPPRRPASARARAGALAALLLAAALAGCAKEDAPLQEQAIPPGLLEGTVTDVALLPIADANVTVDGTNLSARTDATGAFRFELLPGEYVVLATAPEHRNAALRASVHSSQTSALAFTLEPVPRVVPYHHVQEAQGYLACEALLVQGGTRTSLPCGENDPNAQPSVEFALDALDGLEALVIEVAWEPTTDAARALRLDVTGRAGDEVVALGQAEGASPIKLQLSGRLLEPGTLVVTASPAGGFTDDEAGLDAGAVLQQTFQAYASYFHHEGPPPGYSALSASSG